MSGGPMDWIHCYIHRFGGVSETDPHRYQGLPVVPLTVQGAFPLAQDPLGVVRVLLCVVPPVVWICPLLSGGLGWKSVQLLRTVLLFFILLS